MSTRLALAGVLGLGLVFALAPGTGSAADGEPLLRGQGSGASTATVPASDVTCTWKWRWKKRVRWIRRNGRKKRVVKYRKVRVKVCRTVSPPDPARLGVKAWEFGFTLSAKTIRSGDTIIELNNRGEDDHNLHVQPLDEPGELSTPDVGPGGIYRIRFNTAPGVYRLWCSLPNHATWGMDTTFVAAASP